ncbi:hypothetical protein BJ508DRAFT_307608 [Ascobolus immersus RN42]|uniref:Uncharacterized protein n=1 Tax=Ascobolus immersus RN42 TaxID=1160509 RepID=A0A3N4I7X0_ASCIM|nr:hypothetical protein BJ508DRAFT_307608 [Ascobolus immersus RN42]
MPGVKTCPVNMPVSISETSNAPVRVELRSMKMHWLRIQRMENDLPVLAELGERASICLSGTSDKTVEVVVERRSQYNIPENTQTLHSDGLVQYKFFLVPAFPYDVNTPAVNPTLYNFEFDANSPDFHDSPCRKHSVLLPSSDFRRCFCKRKMDILVDHIDNAGGTGFLKFTTVTRPPSPSQL